MSRLIFFLRWRTGVRLRALARWITPKEMWAAYIQGVVRGYHDALREARRPPEYDTPLGDGWVRLGVKGPAPSPPSPDA